MSWPAYNFEMWDMNIETSLVAELSRDIFCENKSEFRCYSQNIVKICDNMEIALQILILSLNINQDRQIWYKYF